MSNCNHTNGYIPDEEWYRDFERHRLWETPGLEIAECKICHTTKARSFQGPRMSDDYWSTGEREEVKQHFRVFQQRAVGA